VTSEEATMEGPLSFFLFYFLVVPFLLMNITAYRKERKKADEELHELLRENNNLLKELLATR
jgi:cbb3-type cytochrome oxidase subunit 3